MGPFVSGENNTLEQESAGTSSVPKTQWRVLEDPVGALASIDVTPWRSATALPAVVEPSFFMQVVSGYTLYVERQRSPGISVRHNVITRKSITRAHIPLLLP